MITYAQVRTAVQHHKQAMPPGAVMRWAFLVTIEEIASIVDEIVANPELVGVELDPQHAAHIKEGRAALHIDDVMVLPELVEREHRGLDG